MTGLDRSLLVTHSFAECELGVESPAEENVTVASDRPPGAVVPFVGDTLTHGTSDGDAQLDGASAIDHTRLFPPPRLPFWIVRVCVVLV